MARSELVVFRNGFSARAAVVERLLSIECRGARFALLADGGFRVEPASVLTPGDAAFLRAHRVEARAVVRYQADDVHLFTDATRAQRTPLLEGRGERVA